MTITEANKIWEACYGPESWDIETWADAWDSYTQAQREQAIATRDASVAGSWGTWNISDRDWPYQGATPGPQSMLHWTRSPPHPDHDPSIHDHQPGSNVQWDSPECPGPSMADWNAPSLQRCWADRQIGQLAAGAARDLRPSWSLCNVSLSGLGVTPWPDPC